MVGLLTGAGAVARLEAPRPLPLLRPPVLPREGLSIPWSTRALWPADIQAIAMERLTVVVVALVALAALLATLNVVTLLADSAASRRAELAVRSAVGATPRSLVVMLLGELRVLGALALSVGLLAGGASGLLLRRAWPGTTEPVAWLESPGLATLLGVLAVLVAGVHVSSGLRSARPDRAGGVLRAGTRTGVDPMAIFGRKVLTAGHASVAGALLVAALTLSQTARQRGTPSPAPDRASTFVLSASAPGAGAWAEGLARVARVPGIEAESLSTPGALLGLGVRDLATAECGRCSRGLMPAPLWTVVADHHAVTPGYFELADIALLDGRDFGPTEESEPVALVNQTFARTAFERGDPIGKRVRVGSGLHSWYRVIGVVADAGAPVLGRDEIERSAIYLDARAHTPRTGVVVLRGTSAAARTAADLLSARGFAVDGPLDADGHRIQATATLRWTERLAVLIALLALATAAHGVYVAALQTTRRRRGEIAVRRSLGASTRHIGAFVLGERLRVIGWGLAGFVFLGTLMVALLSGAAGLPVPGPPFYVVIGSGLCLIGLAASVRAAREAMAVDPAVLLD